MIQLWSFNSVYYFSSSLCSPNYQGPANGQMWTEASNKTANKTGLSWTEMANNSTNNWVASLKVILMQDPLSWSLILVTNCELQQVECNSLVDSVGRYQVPLVSSSNWAILICCVCALHELQQINIHFFSNLTQQISPKLPNMSLVCISFIAGMRKNDCFYTYFSYHKVAILASLFSIIFCVQVPSSKQQFVHGLIGGESSNGSDTSEERRKRVTRHISIDDTPITHTYHQNSLESSSESSHSPSEVS